MDFFFGLFGKKKEIDTVSPSTKAVNSIKDSIEMLNKKQIFIEKNINQLRSEASDELKNGNKNKAILLLKKVKMNEKELENIAGMLHNLELQLFAVERTIFNKEIVESIKGVNSIMTNMSGTIKIDEVTEMMDSMHEHIEDLDEIGQILSQPVGSQLSEDELLKDLEKISISNEDKMIKELKEAPIVKKEKINKNKVREDDELSKLEVLLS